MLLAKPTKQLFYKKFRRFLFLRKKERKKPRGVTCFFYFISFSKKIQVTKPELDFAFLYFISFQYKKQNYIHFFEVAYPQKLNPT